MSYQSFRIIFSRIRRPILQIVDFGPICVVHGSQRDSEGVCKDMNVIVALMNNETDTEMERSDVYSWFGVIC